MRDKLPGGAGRLALHKWVRLAMYGSLLLVALMLGWQVRQIEVAESQRLVDAEVIHLAASQGTLVQRLGLLASQTRQGATQAERDKFFDQIDRTLAQVQAQAVRLDELLARHAGWADASVELQMALQDWQTRRERIWYRTQGLLWGWWRGVVGTGDLAESFVQDEIDPFLQSAERLVEQLQRRAQQQARGVINQIEVLISVMGMLLLGLVFGVAEPLTGFVRRQQADAQRKSAQLQQLALVAGRTSNWVAVTDAQRLVLWCNEAFLRGKGARMEDVLGQHAALLQENEFCSHEQLQQLLAELDHGRGIRVEVMHPLPDGHRVWLDVDYQPIFDDEVLTGFTLVASDITERVNERIRMRSLLDSLPVAVVVQAADGKIVDFNPAATALLGLAPEDVVGTELISLGDVMYPDLSPWPIEDRLTVRTLRTHEGQRASVVMRRRDGELRWLVVNTDALRDADGRFSGVVSCSVDVTEQHAQQELLALAIESASLGVWQWELGTGEMSCNERMLALFGARREEVVMTSDAWNALIHPDDLAGWQWAIRSNLRDSQRPLHWEIRVRQGNGDWRWLMYSGTVVARDGEGRALRMAGVAYDVHAQKELEGQLRQAARTDALTSLPNRSELLNRIQLSLLRAEQSPGYHFAVLFMDFDRFKQINDTLGHAVGDELLRQIALRLQDSLRPGDAFVQPSDFQQMAARIGGDEFVVVLDEIRGDLDAQVVASRLLEVLAEPYQIGTHRVSSTVSIGIVTTEHMAGDADSILRDADIAMYEAKREGRGRYVMFDPSMRKRLRDDVSLENDLRQALGQGELFVVYQPIIEFGSGQLAAVEALVRWQHPQRGRVSPLAFVPVAESTGLIGVLGRFVLKKACEEFVALQAQLGMRAPQQVSVNLSRAQLREPGLVEDILEILRATDVSVAQLVLEVTESLAAQDEVVKDTLAQIRALGIALSLDDFGTGYSSLSCLHELPVSVVKIDRSFVDQALTSNYHRVMIEATIRMAQTLGLRTVAEGIETPDQAALMQALGCGKGQGYLYSPPLTAGELVDWIEAQAVPVASLSA